MKYFAHSQKKQEGPWTEEQLQSQVKAAKYSSRTFIWAQGWEDWRRLGEVFPAWFAATTPVDPHPARERRRGPRRPFLARLWAAASPSSQGVGAPPAALIEGLIADLSAGGMKVLTDAALPRVGDSLRVNVTPVGSVGETFSPFVAVGEVVRVFQNGFSLKFIELNATTRSLLERLLSSTALSDATRGIRKAS